MAQRKRNRRRDTKKRQKRKRVPARSRGLMGYLEFILVFAFMGIVVLLMTYEHLQYNQMLNIHDKTADEWTVITDWYGYMVVEEGPMEPIKLYELLPDFDIDTELDKDTQSSTVWQTINAKFPEEDYDVEENEDSKIQSITDDMPLVKENQQNEGYEVEHSGNTDLQEDGYIKIQRPRTCGNTEDLNGLIDKAVANYPENKKDGEELDENSVDGFELEYMMISVVMEEDKTGRRSSTRD